jgi:hypothetical protein
MVFGIGNLYQESEVRIQEVFLLDAQTPQQGVSTGIAARCPLICSHEIG